MIIYRAWSQLSAHSSDDDIQIFSEYGLCKQVLSSHGTIKAFLTAKVITIGFTQAMQWAFNSGDIETMLTSSSNWDGNSVDLMMRAMKCLLFIINLNWKSHQMKSTKVQLHAEIETRVFSVFYFSVGGIFWLFVAVPNQLRWNVKVDLEVFHRLYNLIFCSFSSVEIIKKYPKNCWSSPTRSANEIIHFVVLNDNIQHRRCKNDMSNGRQTLSKTKPGRMLRNVEMKYFRLCLISITQDHHHLVPALFSRYLPSPNNWASSCVNCEYKQGNSSTRRR